MSLFPELALSRPVRRPTAVPVPLLDAAPLFAAAADARPARALVERAIMEGCAMRSCSPHTVAGWLEVAPGSPWVALTLAAIEDARRWAEYRSLPFSEIERLASVVRRSGPNHGRAPMTALL